MKVAFDASMTFKTMEQLRSNDQDDTMLLSYIMAVPGHWVWLSWEDGFVYNTLDLCEHKASKLVQDQS